MNAHIGKDGNKFNKNGKYLADFSLEDRLVHLNTKFPSKKREGKLWIYTNPNKSKEQLDYIFINKKWIKSTENNKVYSSFERVFSDHRIISAKICQNLYRNKTQTIKASQCDWSSLNNSDIKNQYTITVRNKFDTLQETDANHTSNGEFENFITTHIEAAAK